LRSVGEGYTIALDNGPARREQSAQKLQAAGDLIADMVEISNVRREDYKIHDSEDDHADIYQLKLHDKSGERCHQIAGAFLTIISGLDKHGIDSDHPIKYTHLDTAGSESMGGGPGGFGTPIGAMVVALAQRYVIPKM